MNLLNFYIPEWFFVALNLVILVFVLNKILWEPINKVLSDRQKKIDNAMLQALEIETEKQNLAAHRLKSEEELEAFISQQMKDARVRAGKEYDRIVLEAENKARSIVAAAVVQAGREREALLRDTRMEMISMALDATGALLEETMTSEENQKFLEKLMARKEVV